MGCAIGNIGLEGVPPEKLAEHLWNRRRLIVTPILHEEFQGLRVTPNVYTTLREVDAFAEEMEKVIAKGLPA
jgi:selenocysteine lyase/cysteine desulfurase